MGHLIRVGGVTLTGLATAAFLIKRNYLDEYKEETLSKALSQAETTQNSGATDELQLKCVQIFFRHGARTPLKHVPGVEEVLKQINS